MRPLISLFLVLGVSLLGGCFADAGDGGGGDDGSAFGGPRSGLWHFSEHERENDTCNPMNPPALSSGDFDIINHEDGSFSVIPRAEGERFECEHDGYEFVCDDLMPTWSVPFVQAQFNLLVKTTGQFEDNTRGDGQYDVTVDCVGDQCNLAVDGGYLAALPCAYIVPFTSVFVE